MELHFKAVSALSEKKVAEIQIQKRIPVSHTYLVISW